MRIVCHPFIERRPRRHMVNDDILCRPIKFVHCLDMVILYPFIQLMREYFRIIPQLLKHSIQFLDKLTRAIVQRKCMGNLYQTQNISSINSFRFLTDIGFAASDISSLLPQPPRLT